MTIAAIREKLHDYINVADDKKIEAIYTLLEEQIGTEYDWASDQVFMTDLDNRAKRYEAGTDRGFSLDDLEHSIEALKKQRIGK